MLVYDLGGGTFDVTVLRIAGGDFDVLATGGDAQLGGFNWDNALMVLLNDRFTAEGGADLMEDDATEADLREKAEIAKHSLTSVEKTRVVLGSDGVSKVVTVSRAEFEDVTSGLLSRTRDIAENVLEDSGLDWSGIDRLLLVGGATRMPMVRTMIEAVVGKAADRSINPDEVVAMGAAIQASLVDSADNPGGAFELLMADQPVVVSDVTSQALGTLVLDEAKTAVVNSIIIPPNTKIPAKRSDQFFTVRDQQTEIEVEVTQGDDEDPDYVRVLGKQTFSIPPYPARAPIEITYAYDIDQMIFIEATDLTTGTRIGTFEVANEANMDVAEVEQATRRLRTIEAE